MFASSQWSVTNACVGPWEMNYLFLSQKLYTKTNKSPLVVLLFLYKIWPIGFDNIIIYVIIKMFHYIARKTDFVM